MFNRMPRFYSWGTLLVAMTSIGNSVLAQTPPALASPNLSLYTNGTVYASARMDDGGLVFGGRFSQVNGIARSNIARLKADGSLDPDWNPGADYPVKALVNDNKGHIYAGSPFFSLGGQPGPVARFASQGAGNIDTGWKANIYCGNFYSLATNSAGDVFAGGYCQSPGTSVTTGVIKLSGETGAAVPMWSVRVDNVVYAIAVDADDNLYLGGPFSQVAGQSRMHLAKVSSLDNGQLDSTWNPAPANSGGGSGIYSLLIENQGSLIVGGAFTSIGGQSLNNIARLSTTGTGNADASWNPSPNGTVKSLAIDGRSRIYVGGTFSSIGGQSVTALARLSPTGSGSADSSWSTTGQNPSDSIVNTLTINGNGNVYAGGFFSLIGNQERHSLAMIGADGSLSPPIDVKAPGGVVNAIAKQPGGGLIVAGYFSGSGSLVRSNLLRVQPDGTVDPNWSASTDAPNYMGVEAVAAAADGSIYVGGEFGHINGKSQSGIAKLGSNGALDSSWNSSANSVGDFFLYGVRAIALASDGGVYVGGDYSSIGGTARTCLAKISNGGVVDPIWNPYVGFSLNDSTNGVTAIAVDSTGAVYAASDVYGQYSNIQLSKFSGQGSGSMDPTWKSRSDVMAYALLLDGKGSLYVGGDFVTKLSTLDGSIDPAWEPTIYGELSFTSYYRPTAFAPAVYALALDGAGSLYIGGLYSIVSQTATSSSNTISALDQRSRPYLAKLSANGTAAIDPAWNPGPNDIVYALATDTNGNLYAGGTFSQIGNQSRNGFATLPQAAAPNPIIPDHLDQFGWTGAWYNPAASGQGMLFQVIPSANPMKSGTLFGAWFTFNPSGDNAGQRWYTLQGPVDGTSKTVALPVYATEYYQQGNPSSSPTNVGNAILTFQDCTHATVTYSVADPAIEGGSSAIGAFPLVRLSSNISCTPNGDTPYGPDYSLSGSWYDSTYSFSGLLFSVDPASNTFFATWFRNDYSRSAQPGMFASKSWYTMQSAYAPGTTSIENMAIYSTTGGVLDDPSPVTRTVVGSASLVINNCNSATLSYTFTGGPDSGTQGTLNLTRGAGKPASCNP